MVFADVGDELALSRSQAMALQLRGPFAGGLDAGPGNLVVQARDALLARAGGHTPGFRIVLDKRLPVAAGLGGGSADAAAALRLIRRVMAPGVSDADLLAIAGAIGSDGPACLLGRPVLGTGRGDVLTPVAGLPRLSAVLVNPMVASPTAEVYRAYDAAPATADQPEWPSAFDSIQACVHWLRGRRNDLEEPAMRLRPAIGRVLQTLSGQPECRLARMSGSGATCFALTEDDRQAEALAGRLSAAQPGWWVRSARLGGATAT